MRTPSVDVTANGQQLPLTLGDDPLRIDLAFDASPSGIVNPAEVYFGLATASGAFFLDPTFRLSPFPVPLYTGPLVSFPPVTVVNLPSAGVLPPGTYVWFVVVDANANGVIEGTFFDYVITFIAH